MPSLTCGDGREQQPRANDLLHEHDRHAEAQQERRQAVVEPRLRAGFRPPGLLSGPRKYFRSGHTLVNIARAPRTVPGVGIARGGSRSSEVGRQVEAKWYSSAVSWRGTPSAPHRAAIQSTKDVITCRQVGQSAVTFTVPLITMNLTHWARSSHATAGHGPSARRLHQGA